MNPQLHFLMSVASLACAVFALGISVMTAFPALRTGLAVVRDGVLWLALFFVLGGAGFVVWQRLQQLPGTPTETARSEALTSIDRDFGR